MQIICFKKMDFFSFPSDENEWPFSPGNLLLSLRMIVRFWLSLPVTIFLRLSILFYLDFLFLRTLSTGVSGFSASGCRGFSFEEKTQGRKKERKKGFIDALSQQKWWKIVESWRHYSCKMRGNNAKGKYYLPPKSLPLPLCSPMADGIYTNASCYKHIKFPTIKNISLFEVLNDQVSS